MTPRQEFTARFQSAMRRTGYTYTQLGSAIGSTRQNARELATGRVPSAQLAQRVAEALDDPMLLDLALAARKIACSVCGRTVVAQTFRRRYCGDSCGLIARTLGRRAPSEAESALVWEINGHRAAVEAMCRACEPDGVCRMVQCPLRAVSPFPVALNETVTVPAARNGWEDPDRRARMSTFMRGEWDRNRDRRLAAVRNGIAAGRVA